MPCPDTSPVTAAPLAKGAFAARIAQVVPVLALLMLLLIPARAAQAGMELLMVEQPGCVYCQRWHAEIGSQYPLTDEGRAAPLRVIQLRAPVPEGIRLASPAGLTPTFILVKDGIEQARMEGYPGEHFFWPILAQMIQRANVD